MNEPDIIPCGKSKYRGVHFVYNEDEACTVREFYETFKDDLPELLYITQGQYALTELETFSAEQLIRIHNTHVEKRVIAHTNKNQKLSIPLDYKLKFCVVEGRNKVGEPECLKHIVSRKLPVMVQFAPTTQRLTASVSGHVETVADFGIMTLSEIYDEVYLVGNCLNVGWLCRRVTIMPLYLPDVLLARVTGLEEGEEKWRQMQEYMDFQIRTVSLAGLRGNNDIALFTGDSEEDHVYDYIRMSFESDEKQKEGEEEGKNKKLPDASKQRAQLKGDNFEKTQLKGDNSDYMYVSSSVPNPYEPFLSVRKKNPPALPPNHPSTETQSAPPVPPRDKASARSPTTRVPKGAPQDQASAHYLNHGEDLADFDVTRLTIQELAHALKMLKLDKYARGFKKKAVDGRILKDLVEDKEGMVKDFSMSATDFIKLKHYAQTGYIPH